MIADELVPAGWLADWLAGCGLRSGDDKADDDVTHTHTHTRTRIHTQRSRQWPVGSMEKVTLERWVSKMGKRGPGWTDDIILFRSGISYLPPPKVPPPQLPGT